MAETEKQEEQKEAEDSGSKGSVMKFIMMGLVGAVIVAGAAIGTMMLMGGDKPETAEQAENVEPAEEPQKHDEDEFEKSASGGDSHLDLDDSFGLEDMLTEEELLAEMEMSTTTIDNISKSLEFLDVDPNAGELSQDQGGMSVEDSLEQVSWFEKENKKLTDREQGLKKLQKEQEILQRKLDKQIVIIEQAESSRISALAKLYDGMEARSVAKLVANLDDNTVVSIIPRMKQKNASAVLALVPPKRAALLSKKMITISDK